MKVSKYLCRCLWRGCDPEEYHPLGYDTPPYSFTKSNNRISPINDLKIIDEMVYQCKYCGHIGLLETMGDRAINKIRKGLGMEYLSQRWKEKIFCWLILIVLIWSIGMIIYTKLSEDGKIHPAISSWKPTGGIPERTQADRIEIKINRIKELLGEK